MNDTMKLSELIEKNDFAFYFGRGAKMESGRMDDWQRSAKDYSCKIVFQTRRYSFDFFVGTGCAGDPDLQGCLDCLLSDAQGGDQSFEDFCGDSGYDIDSRKAEAAWKACRRTARNLKRLLGDQYESFLYAERD